VSELHRWSPTEICFGFKWNNLCVKLLPDFGFSIYNSVLIIISIRNYYHLKRERLLDTLVAKYGVINHSTGNKYAKMKSYNFTHKKYVLASCLLEYLEVQHLLCLLSFPFNHFDFGCLSFRCLWSAWPKWEYHNQMGCYILDPWWICSKYILLQHHPFIWEHICCTLCMLLKCLFLLLFPLVGCIYCNWFALAWFCPVSYSEI